MSADEASRDINEHLNAGSELRLILQTEKASPLPSLDPELKATLHDMKRRYRVTRERLKAGDEAPDAA